MCKIHNIYNKVHKYALNDMLHWGVVSCNRTAATPAEMDLC